MAHQIIRCECGKRLKVDTNLVGRRAKCPFCQKVFFVPKASQQDPFDGLRPDSSIIMFRPSRSSEDDDAK